MKVIKSLPIASLAPVLALSGCSSSLSIEEETDSEETAVRAALRRREEAGLSYSTPAFLGVKGNLCAQI